VAANEPATGEDATTATRVNRFVLRRIIEEWLEWQ
jgi:hypothetical protein